MVPALLRRYSLVGSIRFLAKLATRRRRYYAIVDDRRVLTDGWILFGSCRFYDIEPDSCVVGPIHTDPDVRGHGLATAALSRAVEWCISAGVSKVYIDTTSTNVAGQRVITASGFRRAAST